MRHRAWAIVLFALFSCCAPVRVIILKDALSAIEHINLGVAYESRGELEEAAREYRAALKKEPGLVQARVNLGNVLSAQGDFGGAERAYRRALREDPLNPAARNNLSWIAVKTGRGLEEARRIMEALVAEDHPERYYYLDTLGMVYRRLGEEVRGRRIIREALSLCQKHRVEAVPCREIERHLLEPRE